MNEKQDLSYIMIEDKTIPVVLERKERKTLSIGIQEDGSLMIKAPLYMKKETIERFLNQKRYWIYKQAKRMEDNRKNQIVYSREQGRVLRQQARIKLTERTDYYKKILGVETDSSETLLEKQAQKELH